MKKTLRLPGCFPVEFEFSAAHWERNGTNHGPQSRPRVFAVRLVQLAGFKEETPGQWVHRPTPDSWRLWFYFRGGFAAHADLWIDNRPLHRCEACEGRGWIT